jgi:hypothetical protein
LVTCMLASNEQAWEPMASSSANSCRKTRTAPHRCARSPSALPRSYCVVGAGPRLLDLTLTLRQQHQPHPRWPAALAPLATPSGRGQRWQWRWRWMLLEVALWVLWKQVCVWVHHRLDRWVCQLKGGGVLLLLLLLRVWGGHGLLVR